MTEDKGNKLMITREELYKEIWTLPATKVAKRLGVSDSYLARVCDMLEIPRPHRGYWRKLEAGRAPPVPELPEARPRTPKSWKRQTAFVRPKRPEKRATPKPRTASQTHPCVRDAEKTLSTGKVDAYGHLQPRAKVCADIKSSSGSLDRCLKFSSLLYNRLKHEGHDVSIARKHDRFLRPAVCTGDDEDFDAVGWSPIRPTVTYINAAPLGLAICEMTRPVRLRYVGLGKYIPEKEYREQDHVGPTWVVNRRVVDGRIKLTAFSPIYQVPWSASWIILPKAALGEQLDAIIAGLNYGSLELVLRLQKAGKYFQH